ncbi:TspO/MBR family protein [Pseudoxanthomonas winnipegensis]|uniref:Tryptophan-rich sensory protein n=1 Tax=Pseudoxanthomonas winnipegensis TaxID=2480810 RepID=A0A4Q8M217_9GAMM|nr:TspO/MBR family protein [Pseudoxanthomonas winnipegensis]TAA40137.1 tryptophan-rich sensory protein [Pseudoxanthomonas winnipegensis]
MQGISGKRRVLGLVGWLLLVFVAGTIGAAASVQAATFYATLAQPSWAPPAAVFGPVWSVLYVLMGIAAWLVWRRGGWAAQRRALTVFVAQLALNALWSWLFFGWHLGAAAMLDIVVLWVLIVVTVAMFWRARPLAGLLLLPYLAWVTFASALNYAVWQLNPQALG